MPDLARLAAQLRGIADQLDAGDPLPDPDTAPGKPTGLAWNPRTSTLTWDPAADAAHWEVRDDRDPDPATRVKAVVDEPRSPRSPLTTTSRPRRYVIVAVGPTGLRSEASDPLDVLADEPAPLPPPTPTPAAGVDLSRWKLTIPLGKGVAEIKPPTLATYVGPHFGHLADGSLRFRVWHGEGTTSGSLNPRSELRERVGDDPEGYWQAGTGRHVMEWTGQVNRLTRVKPHVVIGQVHDRDDDVCVWRVEADKLWLTDGDNTHGFLVDAAFQLGTPYTCRYEIVDGDYRFFYNGVRLDYPLRSATSSYFKVGCYLQSNPTSAPGESTSEYSEVILTRVLVEHSA